ncbi:hypothetical protein D7X96_22090 [Corallococcus interemptor]|uniref:Uncharacterized protein n=1 Tax=Corallococcus interemptor TaxID=2316720 RepID=A0A3A8QEW1_9BACT|nr:hypothetical protein [Corallococcus interemptor]RKH66191.1 hypothetical protein D7X96_22090 [Corallococcus interemptor]
MPGIQELVEFAEGSRKIGVDMVNFAWIGDLDEGSEKAFQGVRTASHLTNVPWNRIVFWCESRNKRVAETVLHRINPKIWVMSMSELFTWWKQDTREASTTVAETARHVYTSLKRLAALSAAKDLASLCILRVVGGYFFDASVEFVLQAKFFTRFGKQPPPEWKTDTTMPVLTKSHWVGDAWALYAHPYTDTTRRALNTYLVMSSKAGINHRKGIGPGFYTSEMPMSYTPDTTSAQFLFKPENLGLQDEDLRIRQERVGLIQDMIMSALAAGWGEEKAEDLGQRDVETGQTPILTLPHFGLVKVPGSSLMEYDPSKWTGWKATPFRDWTKRR